MDAIIWAWDMAMTYIAALFVIPLCAIASLKALGGVWPEPGRLVSESDWFRALLPGAPVWIAATLYVRFNHSGWAVRLQRRLDQLRWVVIWATCAGLAMFALLALLLAR